MSMRGPVGVSILTWAGTMVLAGGTAFAQVTPAAGYTPPDDTPTVKVGGTIYADFTYTDKPTSVDADGNVIHPSSFDIRRAYINVTGSISHLVSFRITPDVAPHLTTTASGLPTGARFSTNLDGSLTLRLKYGYGQINFDDFLTKGSWLRIGLQQTPYLDYTEGIYRYRFQGTLFPEREGFLGSDSSDFGISTHYNLPSNYGDLHLGVYNGDTYTKPDPNDQKAFEVRGSLRPFPRRPVLKGLRVTGFYKADSVVKNAARDRFIGGATFEHARVVAGFEYLDAKDRASAAKPEVHAQGWSVWTTPKSKIGLEGFLRYDSLKPDTAVDARRNRTIVGAAYWFHTEASPAAGALLLDYEQVKNDSALSRPDEKRVSLHCLFNF
jgi:hypothetical protein